VNTAWTFTTTNDICISAWQVSRWYLLHSINQRINYCYFHYWSGSFLPIVDLLKALSFSTFCCRPLSVRHDLWRIFWYLLHLCSIVEGSLLHVARITRARLTASFCPTLSPRKVAWDLGLTLCSHLLEGRSDYSSIGSLAHWVSVLILCSHILVGLTAKAESRLALWVSVKSVVAVLMIVLLL